VSIADAIVYGVIYFFLMIIILEVIEHNEK